VLVLHSDIDSLKKVIDGAYLNDDRYRFIDTPAGLNVGAARNIGIEKAKGDYIYFLDSDDYISENMLQLLSDNIGDFPVMRGRMKSTDFSSSSVIILSGTNKVKMYSKKRYNLLRTNLAINFMISKEGSERMHMRIDEELTTYSAVKFMVKVNEIKDDSTIDQYFEGLVESIKKIDPERLENKDFILKNDVKAIQSNRKNIFRKLSNFNHLLRDIKKGMASKKGRKELLYKRVFKNMDFKDNLVVFESFQGKSYSDRPNYIYEYMLENKRDYKYVWVMNKPVKIPGKPETVKRFSLKYYYYLARAKYVISNVRMPNSYIKRDGQSYLQTWHGTPLKRLAGDMADVHMPGTN